LYELIFSSRDPIFGIITIFLIIFIASFATYTFNINKERNARRSYKKLLKKFQLNTLKEDDYTQLFTTYNLPFDSILLYASSFIHKGEYNKAIKVYLSLLDHVKEKVKKEELLELLGNTYYKGGFLQRSKDIYLQILQFSPHNITALKSLLYVYEKLKDYSKYQEVLGSLNELGEDTIRESIFMNTLKVIDNKDLTYDEKTYKLDKIVEMNKIVERLFVEFLLKYNKKYLFENINSFNISKIIDLMWHLDFDDIDFENIKNNQLLQELYTAKAYLNTVDSSDIFEFNVLIATNAYKNNINIDLNFDFICTSCKKLHPIYAYRCPHCSDILTFKVKPILSKGLYEKNSSLQ
jgi:tetratricopeptide (TPR) repeat protein